MLQLVAEGEQAAGDADDDEEIAISRPTQRCKKTNPSRIMIEPSCQPPSAVKSAAASERRPASARTRAIEALRYDSLRGQDRELRQDAAILALRARLVEEAPRSRLRETRVAHRARVGLKRPQAIRDSGTLRPPSRDSAPSPRPGAPRRRAADSAASFLRKSAARPFRPAYRSPFPA